MSEPAHGTDGTLVDVGAWHGRLARLLPGEAKPRAANALVARFRDIDARIGQPALDRTVLSIHLGGPKRVIRRQGGRVLDMDVAENSLTLMPEGEPFEWETFGAIDFAHFPLDKAEFSAAVEAFDRDPAVLRLEPLVGVFNRPMANRLNALLGLGPECDEQRIYRDTLSLMVTSGVIETFSRGHVAACAARRAGTLATWQLRRVVDYMREHLADDIDLAALVSLTGLGRAQFFRSFHRSIGRTPFAHLRHLRLLRARQLLADTTLSVTEIASVVGLEPTRLSAAFRADYATTPSAFRSAARR
jgi:AraC family transcriptional regulator